MLSRRFEPGGAADLGPGIRRPDELIVEEPLSIRLDDVQVSSTMRTPGHDFELAAGFLHGDGLLAGAAITTCRYCGTGSAVETEFNVRQDGYPGLAAKYGFDASRAQRQILQTGIIYQATADGDQCKFGEVFTTDGRIIALDLVLLDDDLQFFPKYNPALVMKKDFAEAHPQVAEVMAPISERLTNEVMTELNRQVDVDGKEPADVARDWLVSEGFVTAQ